MPRPVTYEELRDLVIRAKPIFDSQTVANWGRLESANHAFILLAYQMDSKDSGLVPSGPPYIVARYDQDVKPFKVEEHENVVSYSFRLARFNDAVESVFVPAIWWQDIESVRLLANDENELIAWSRPLDGMIQLFSEGPLPMCNTPYVGLSLEVNVRKQSSTQKAIDALCSEYALTLKCYAGSGMMRARLIGLGVVPPPTRPLSDVLPRAGDAIVN